MSFWTLHNNGEDITCCEPCALDNTNVALNLAKDMALLLGRPDLLGNFPAQDWPNMAAAAMDVAVMAALTGSTTELTEQSSGTCSRCGISNEAVAS
jgi:hypothetical protein